MSTSPRVFNIKTGATRPVYDGQLLDEVGTSRERPIDLSSADDVFLILRNRSNIDEPTVNAEMTIVDPEDGKVRYIWDEGDTDVAGSYDVEVKINWSDGGVEYIPNGTYETVRIRPNVED